MFDNISYGLLFAMFTELSVECTQQSAALTIVSKNMCFQGTKFTASSEGARLLTQVYSKRISGPVFARKKLAWRKGEKGASEDLLAWLKQSVLSGQTSTPDPGTASPPAPVLSFAAALNAPLLSTPGRSVTATELPGFGAPKGRAAKIAAVKLQQAQLLMSAAERNIAATEHHGKDAVLATQKHHSIITMNTRSSGHVKRTVYGCEVRTSYIEGAGMGVFSTEIVPKGGICTGY